MLWKTDEISCTEHTPVILAYWPVQLDTNPDAFLEESSPKKSTYPQVSAMLAVYVYWLPHLSISQTNKRVRAKVR